MNVFIFLNFILWTFCRSFALFSLCRGKWKCVWFFKRIVSCCFFPVYFSFIVSQLLAGKCLIIFRWMKKTDFSDNVIGFYYRHRYIPVTVWIPARVYSNFITLFVSKNSSHWMTVGNKRNIKPKTSLVNIDSFIYCIHSGGIRLLYIRRSERKETHLIFTYLYISPDSCIRI